MGNKVIRAAMVTVTVGGRSETKSKKKTNSKRKGGARKSALVVSSSGGIGQECPVSQLGIRAGFFRADPRRENRGIEAGCISVATADTERLLAFDCAEGEQVA